MSLVSALSRIHEYEIFGASRNTAAIEFAYKKGFVKNKITYKDNCDIEILCVSKQAILDILSNDDIIGDVVVDICGTKQEIVAQVLKHVTHSGYVSVHPMVHIDPQGYQFYKENAFVGATIFMINDIVAEAQIVKKVTDIFKNIGANNIITCSALEHDTVLKYSFKN